MIQNTLRSEQIDEIEKLQLQHIAEDSEAGLLLFLSAEEFARPSAETRQVGISWNFLHPLSAFHIDWLSDTFDDIMRQRKKT